MARFARIDKDNIVQSVHVVDNNHLLNEHGVEEEVFGIAYLNNVHGVGFTWVQTSYNTNGGVHRLGGTPFRKNHAGMGYLYDTDRDAFIPPNPFPSWILDEDTCQYVAPIPLPLDKAYIWNEDTTTWDERE
jgi:hypothetical protein